MADAALPPGWEKRIDPGSGRAFYIDHSTKQVRPSTPLRLSWPLDAIPHRPFSNHGPCVAALTVFPTRLPRPLACWALPVTTDIRSTQVDPFPCRCSYLIARPPVVFLRDPSNSASCSP